jgi:hypothetical protein
MNIYLKFVWIAALTIVSVKSLDANNIRVDQFGYMPGAKKVAVIVQANVGKFSPDTYVPGTKFEVRKLSDNSAVFEGAPLVWNNGSIQPESSDKVWHFDFSSVTQEGDYYVYDVEKDKKSYAFRIATNVYDEVLKAATRVFYYQRRSTDKPAQYAGIDWADGEAFLNAKQDAECMLYGSADINTRRDLRGGWFDAGDYNQYITFTVSAMNDLLKAYLFKPAIWGDNTNIPESGNGVPDILDELKWELDWMLRMQESNGGVLCVKGEPANISGASTPPSAYKKEQRYGPATTAASYAASAVFALAAKVYAQAKQPTYSLTLRNAAERAYQWAMSNPSVKFTNAGKLCAGENQPDDNGVTKLKLLASIYLFDLIGGDAYKTFIDSRIDSWTWISMYEGEVSDAWLTYYNHAQATQAVKDKIKSKYMSGVEQNGDYLAGYNSGSDAYRAFLRAENYTWGSNKTKSSVANLILNTTRYGVKTDSAIHSQAAQGYLSYMHGVNALNLCFVTNMSSFGAENSAKQIYHTWFGHGSKWSTNPPPGYIPGGANKYYKLDGCCPSGCGSSDNNNQCNNAEAKAAIGQPAQKCYADINNSWPVNSWEITEPGIYYQAAYVRLVSSFVVTGQSVAITEDVLRYSGSLGVDNQSEIQTLLYPNPTSGIVKINLNGSEPLRVEVTTISGVKVPQRFSRVAGELLIDLTGTSPGNYLIEVVSKNKSRKYKIIKL